MAKKKTSKQSSKKNESYSAELWGVLLILIGIMGIGSFGPVGNIIKGFSIFLMGVWYIIALVYCIISGAYMMVKRKKPNFFSVKLIGLYLIMLALLVYSHMEYAIQENLNGKAIIEATVNNFLDSGMNYTVNSGGGIIGGLFTIAFTKMFDFDGTKIVLIVLGVVGAILTFNLNLGNILRWFKKTFNKMKIPEYDDEDEDEEEELTRDGRRKKRKESSDIPPQDDDELIGTTSLKNVRVFQNMSDFKNNSGSGTVAEQMAMSLENNESDVRETDNTNKNYQLPTLDILDKIKPQGKVNSTEFLQTNKGLLVKLLKFMKDLQ